MENSCRLYVLGGLIGVRVSVVFRVFLAPYFYTPPSTPPSLGSIRGRKEEEEEEKGRQREMEVKLLGNTSS